MCLGERPTVSGYGFWLAIPFSGRLSSSAAW